jgi:hypothetical protein
MSPSSSSARGRCRSIGRTAEPPRLTLDALDLIFGPGFRGGARRWRLRGRRPASGRGGRQSRHCRLSAAARARTRRVKRRARSRRPAPPAPMPPTSAGAGRASFPGRSTPRRAGRVQALRLRRVSWPPLLHPRDRGTAAEGPPEVGCARSLPRGRCRRPPPARRTFCGVIGASPVAGSRVRPW